MNGNFDRRTIKECAKEKLKKCYWLAFGVTALIGLLLGEIAFGGDFSFDFPREISNHPAANVPIDSDLLFILVIVGLAVFGIAVAISIAKAYFLDGALIVGRAKFFLSVTRENAQFSDAWDGFKKNYRNVCKVCFTRTIKLILWGMIIVVPCVLMVVFAFMAKPMDMMIMGMAAAFFVMLVPFSLLPVLYKKYEYSMIEYLLAEFPDMSSKEAFAASKELTSGHKMDLLVLDLSFLGWILLGLMCFGIGTLFVEPYMQTAKAQAYARLCALKYPPASAAAPSVQVAAE